MTDQIVVSRLGRYDITFVQGSTFRMTPIWKIGGVPVDVTDFQARLQVRERISDDQTVLSLTEADHITVGTTDGAFEIVVSDEETALLDFRSPGFYDFEVESAGGDVTRLLHGRAGLSREVTREEAS
jgi:hypothetical protein